MGRDGTSLENDRKYPKDTVRLRRSFVYVVLSVDVSATNPPYGHFLFTLTPSIPFGGPELRTNCEHFSLFLLTVPFSESDVTSRLFQSRPGYTSGSYFLWTVSLDHNPPLSVWDLRTVQVNERPSTGPLGPELYLWCHLGLHNVDRRLTRRNRQRELPSRPITLRYR